MKKHSEKKKKTAAPQMITLEESRFAALSARILYGALMLLILGLLLFGVNVSYIHVMDHASNILLLAAGGGALLLLALLCFRIFRKPAEGKNRRTVVLFGLGFMILQAVLIASYYFRTAWDVNHMLTITEAILENPGCTFDSYYLSMYPNNRLLIWLFVLVGKIALAVAPSADLLFVLIEVQCIVCWISGVLLYSLALELSRSRACAVWAYIVFLLLIGLSPWISIPYSDSMCLIFPLLTARLYLKKNLYFQWGFIGITAVIGYYIKPQTLIVDIAILIVVLLKLIRNIKVKNVLSHYLFRGADCAVGVAAAAFFVLLAANSVPMNVDETRVMGPTHYIMMGMNTSCMGGYSDEDVELSYSITDTDLKHETELAVAKERLEAMGPEGYLKHLQSKLLSAYNEGTFFWGGEGMFYYQLYPETGSLSKLTRNIYYSDTGVYYPAYNNYAQALWIGVLLFAGLLFVWKPDELTVILMFSVIGLTLFELLFEVRSRHLIAFVPVFILLASCSAAGLKKFFDGSGKQGIT